MKPVVRTIPFTRKVLEIQGKKKLKGIEIMKNLIEENGITYELNSGIYYPLLKMLERADYLIGKSGKLRLAFLKEHCKATYVSLLTTGKLNEYLHEVDERVRGQVRKITTDLARQRGIDETLKSTDPMCWVCEMNNCKATAEEIVLKEIINK